MAGQEVLTTGAGVHELHVIQSCRQIWLCTEQTGSCPAVQPTAVLWARPWQQTADGMLPLPLSSDAGMLSSNADMLSSRCAGCAGPLAAVAPACALQLHVWLAGGCAPSVLSLLLVCCACLLLSSYETHTAYLHWAVLLLQAPRQQLAHLLLLLLLLLLLPPGPRQQVGS
jgi:hypothetical protein